MSLARVDEVEDVLPDRGRVAVVFIRCRARGRTLRCFLLLCADRINLRSLGVPSARCWAKSRMLTCMYGPVTRERCLVRGT